MKIVHTLKHARRGNGSVHVAVDLACAQVGMGHEVWLLSSGGAYDEVMRQHGVEVCLVPEPTSVLNGLKSLAVHARVVRRVRPDVLHAHMMSSAIIGAVVAAFTRTTLVATMHNSFDRHSRLMAVARVVVAVSSAERDLLLTRGYRAENVDVVLNGTAGSPRAELAAEDLGPLKRPSVMTLSGLHGRKAVDDVIRAFALVAPDFPQWHLNVVGGGPDLEKLEKQVSDLGLKKSIHFLGSSLNPIPLLQESEIFVTASLAEPCGLNVIEARTAGCAIVGTRVGGIPEVLSGGKAGLLVPARDPEAMAGAIGELMGSVDTLEHWRRASREGAEYFSVSRMAQEYDEVYSRVVGSRRSSRRIRCF